MKKIYKTKPKDANDFCVTHYGIPQGRDEKGHTKPWKRRKLKIGDKYDIATDEHGQEIYFTGKFIGWEDNTIITNKGERLPGNISYLALFEVVGYVGVDTDYTLSITKAEK